MNRGGLGGPNSSSSGGRTASAQGWRAPRGSQLDSSSSTPAAKDLLRRGPSGAASGLAGPSRPPAQQQQQQPCRASAAAAVLSIGSGLPGEEPPGTLPRLQWPAPGLTPTPLSTERDWERTEKEKPPKLVKVRLSVHYRVHSRQMLCIGGSQIPFGWSFLSIAKVPMTWLAGDVWQAEVMLPAGQRIEYKYVILEEQDWTKLENEDAEGLVEVTYRSGSDPGEPPDVQVIQKQMAIVAWQPGPNRIVQVPTEEEMGGLQPGDTVERVPARPPARSAFEPPQSPDPFEGTLETLVIGPDGEPLLDRRDVWGWAPPPSTRPANMRGLRFDN